MDSTTPVAMASVGEVRLAYQSIGSERDPALLLVMGLDPNNTALSDNYDKIIREYVEIEVPLPEPILRRAGVMAPTNEVVVSICELAAKLKTSPAPVEDMHKLRKLMGWRGL